MTPSLPDSASSTLIHRLPPEILAQIFHNICHSKAPYWDRIEDQYSCTRVCHFWNNVIESTPNLWSEITVEAYYKHKGIANAELRLRNSKSLPLTVNVYQTAQGNRFPFAVSTYKRYHLRDAWSVVAQNLDRIESLCFEIAGPVAEEILPLSGPLPRLTALTLHAPIDIIKIVGPTYGPPLRTLDINVRVANTDSNIWNVPSRDLECLRLTGAVSIGQDPIKLVARSPKLRELVLNDHRGSPVFPRAITTDPPAPHILSPVLETAVMSGHHFAMLTSWEAPRLVSMRISGDLFASPPGALTFPSLTTLDLSDLRRPYPDALCNLLWGMPSLRRIALNVSSSSVGRVLSLLYTSLPQNGSQAEGGDAVPCAALRDIVISYGNASKKEQLTEVFHHVRLFLESSAGGARAGVCVSLRLREESLEVMHEDTHQLISDYPGRVFTEVQSEMG